MYHFTGWLLTNRTLSGETLSQYVSQVRAHCAKRWGIQYANPSHLAGFFQRYKQLPRQSHTRDPATRALLELVVMDPSIAIATRTAIVVSWNILARPGELTINGPWQDVADVRFLGKDVIRMSVDSTPAYKLNMRHGKHDKYNRGSVEFVLQRVGDPLCAVGMLDEYCRLLPLEGREHLPFFIKGKYRDNLSYVSKRDMSNALKRHAQAAGLDAAYITGQSLRIGGAFHLADQAVPTEDIQLRGRWSNKRSNEIALMYQRSSSIRLQRVSDAMGPLKVDSVALNTRL